MSSQDNKIFQEAVQILNDSKVNYWLCHGTLLGIVRENALLSWDHDIDFAIWDDENSKEEILKLFSNQSGFQQIIVPEEMNNLHFLTADKRVDINFYTRDQSKAFIKWIAPGSFFLRTYYFFVSLLNSSVSFGDMVRESGGVTKLVKIIVGSVSILVKVILPKFVKQKLHKDLQSRLNYTGYSYPIDFMKFKKKVFLNVGVFIPNESEKVLELTYGKDWKMPKQNYVWHKEAKNLLQQ
jgi:hypothetical protein